ncbi:MAG: hypothetical protein HY608_03335 [Planctomycetes bacterium]|nr:hypothetical protein [Planctomycetota bacterium]
MRARPLHRFVLSCAFLVAAGCDRGQASPPPGGARPPALLAAWQHAAERVRTCEARFDLVKSLPGYDEEIRASGILRYRRTEGDRIEVLFHTREPEELLERVTPDLFETYAPADRCLERRRLEEGSAVQRAFRDALGVLVGAQALERYEVKEERSPARTLLLEPLDGGEERPVDWIRVTLSERTRLPEAFSYATPEGEVRRWRLRDVRVNPDLTDTDLAIEVPEGTEVIEDPGEE